MRKLRKFAKRSNEKIKNKENKHVKKNKQRTYNVEDFSVSDVSSFKFSDINFDDEKDMKEIAALFKKLISKILKFDWIADIDASSHMTDQLQLFSESLKLIKRRTIKIKEKRLYSDQCKTTIMRIKNEENWLIEMLYVPDLEVNLLSERRFIKKELRESFNDDDLYMHIKQNTEMLKASARDDVYIVNQITSELNELALTATTMSASEANELTLIILSTLSVMTSSNDFSFDFNDSDSQDLVEESDISIEFEINVNTSLKKRDLYTLWHRRLAHLNSAKLKSLHKVTTLKKLISIIKNNDSCKVCAIIKMINKRNRHLTERKT